MLFFSQTAFGVSGYIELAAVDGKGPRKRLVVADSSGVVAESGHLLFARDGTLFAQAFDVRTLTLGGELMPIAESMESTVFTGVVSFSISRTGVLAYGRGAQLPSAFQLAWVDRAGRRVQMLPGTTAPAGLDVSPSGNQVVVHRHDRDGGDLWVLDGARGTESRLTFDPAQDNSAPAWSPDGQWIAFQSRRAGRWGIYQKRSDGTGPDELLLTLSAPGGPTGWSPDGKTLVYRVFDDKTKGDLWMLRSAAIEHLRRCSRQRSTRTMAGCRPTDDGWRTAPTRPDDPKCTSCRFLAARASGRSRRRGAFSQAGRGRAASCSSTAFPAVAR